MARILVTGGAGYVGAVLVPKLVNLGHSVTVLDLFLYADTTLFDGIEVRILKGDLRDKDLVREAVRDTEVAIHLAGVSNDPSSDLDPDLTREVNIDATRFLIDCCRTMGVKRFINASSSSVYGIKDEPDVTEDLPLTPLTVYSESKVAIEDYLKDNRGSMTAVSVRSATVCGYSPRMRLDLTVNILTHHAIKKGKITVFGGSQKRPNIHIGDITDFYALMIDAPREKIDGIAFNVCGENRTVAEIADLVRVAVDPKLPVAVEPTNDLRSYHVSAEKVRRVLGFSPKRTLSDAIRDVSEAFKDGRISNPDDDRHYNVRTMKRELELKAARAATPNIQMQATPELGAPRDGGQPCTPEIS